MGGEWVAPTGDEGQDVINPATGEAIARVGFSSASDVDEAVQTGLTAFESWGERSVEERIQPLFRLKSLLEDHQEELADLLVQEHGKTVGEAMGELRRGIENVEAACGAPTLLQSGHVPSAAPESDETGVQEGVDLVVDGRDGELEGYEDGNLLGPCVFRDATADMTIAREEIFGPVINLMSASDFDDALETLNASEYGNAASLFTGSGAEAQRFRHEAEAGNLAVNAGTAAPMAFFHFGGEKDSFFGDLHAQAEDVVRFYTDETVYIERWPNA